MKRWIFTILLFLLLGAVLNVAVAWGALFAAELFYPNPMTGGNDGFRRSREYFATHHHHRDASEQEEAWIRATGWELPSPNDCSEAYLEVWEWRTTGMRRQGIYEAWRFRPGILTTGGWPKGSELAQRIEAGWPLPAVSGLCLDPRAPANRSYYGSLWLRRPPPTVNDPTPRHELLPFWPIWPGFAVNTLFYAIILWLLIPGPFVLRRHIRRKRGRCPKCGYDLRGQLPGAGCPECGWNRQPEAAE